MIQLHPDLLHAFMNSHPPAGPWEGASQTDTLVSQFISYTFKGSQCL